MATDTTPPAPAVVAVVVTCDPGPWFAEVMHSLAGQDYPNLSVLVIDAGSALDPTPVVAEAMPGAFVRRLDARVGFGRAANEVLEIVEGASHYLFLHDDVALDPDATRLLVEEGFRSNAGIVSPKYVRWDDPARLLAVGLTTDKVGARRNLVEPGELDQEQHDPVREVLVAPGGATLVRADLFSALGGFDSVVDCEGEDMDLCWRARLAGARVVVAPQARVRHMEATSGGARHAGHDRALLDRNRYRTLLTCYRATTLAWVVPLAVFWALGEAFTLLVQGRLSAALTVVRSLGGSLAQPRQLLRARSRVQRSRRSGDRELRALQVRGNARLRLFVQSRVDDVRSELEHQGIGARPALAGPGGPEPDADGRAVAPPEPARRGRRVLQVPVLVPVTILVVFLAGSRSLLGRPFPQIGTLPPTAAGWSAMWRSWWSAWQPSGLGVAAAGSPGMAILGLLDTALFGAAGTLEHLLVLGPLLAGPLGAYRLARHWASPRAQLVAAAVYAVVPLPYNALAAGRFQALVVYAGFPWALSLLLRICGPVPIAAGPLRANRGRLALLGLLVAAMASVAPALLYLLPLSGLALVAGSVLVGRTLSSLRLLAVAAAAAVIAFAALLPWSPTVLFSSSALAGADPGRFGRLGFGQVLRFHTGPFGASWLELLIVVASALPLLIGREWRLEWAARLWVLALFFFVFAWAVSRGWLPDLPVDLLLVPAAAGLAGAAALGLVAFELDLPGYNFGWRQAAAAGAGLCLLVAALPWVASVGSGRWDMPRADASAVLDVLLPSASGGDYRVLWIGAPAGLPLPSRSLGGGFGYATTTDGGPGLADEFPVGPAGAAPVLASYLHLAAARRTTRLGHLLAPAGVRYLVVPNHLGPAGAGGAAVPVPVALLGGLAQQTDLEPLMTDTDYAIYQNAAWAPLRSVLPPAAAGAAFASGDAASRQLQETDLDGPAVLTGAGRGPVPTGSQLLVGSTRNSGWRLHVEGRSIGSTPAFGWAMSFAVPAGAQAAVPARLSYSAPLIVRAGYLLQILMWPALATFAVVERRRRRRRGGDPAPDPQWFVPMDRPAPGRRSRSSPTRTRQADLEGAWTDG